MLQFIFSRSGYGKTFKVNQLIKEKLENTSENSPIVLLVPEQISFETEKEMLHLLGPIQTQRVQVLSFKRLAQTFFDRYGGKNKKEIDAIGKTAIMELALQQLQGELVLFKQLSSKPKFIESLLKLNENLKQSAILPEELLSNSTSQSGVLKTKVSEVGLILSLYDTLIESEFYDPIDDLTKIEERILESGFLKDKIVFIDAFSGFTNQQFKLIKKIIQAAESTYFSFGFDGVLGSEDDYSLFFNISKLVKKIKSFAKEKCINTEKDIVLSGENRFKTEEIKHLECNFLAPDAVTFEEEAKAIHLCCAKNIYEECEFVARSIRRVIREKGIRYRDIAVIARETSKYNGIIESTFKRFNIPCFLDDRQGIEYMSVFKFCEYALLCADSKFDTDYIISLLKTGLTSFSLGDIAALELYTSIWQVDKKDWLQEFCGNVEGLEGRQTQENAKKLERLNEIRSFIVQGILNLEQGLKSEDITKISSSIFGLIKYFNVDKNLKKLIIRLEENSDYTQSNLERRSYDLLIHLLDQLNFALVNVKVNSKKFIDLYRSAVALLDIGSLPQGLDEVAIGSALRMRPKSPVVTFIIGANEGEFPLVNLNNSLFTDSELQVLKKNGIELPFYDEFAAIDEQYVAYCAVSSPSHELYVSHYLTDLSGGSITPSIIVQSIKRIFPRCNAQSSTVTYDNVESEVDALYLLCKDNEQQGSKTASIKEYFKLNNQRISNLITDFNNKDLSLSPTTAKLLYGQDLHTSASKIDVFFKCQFFYFCKYGLKAKPIKVAKLDLLQKGSLIHYVLEKVIEQYSVQQITQMDFEEVKSIVTALCKEFLESLFKGREFTKQEETSFINLIFSITQLTIRVFEDLSQSEFKVAYTEFGIGTDQAHIQAYELTLPSKDKLILQGKIDRVDIFKKDEQSFVRIIDYKTGSKSLSLSDVLIGQNLQMLIYMLALQKNGQEKFENLKPAGILYLPAKTTIVEVDKNTDDSEIKELQLKELRMKGLLLNNEDSLLAMEPSKLGRFTPIQFNKNGSLKASTPTITDDDYETICNHIEKKLAQMSLSLHSGKLEINPMDGTTPACAYCDYKSVCLNQDEPQKAQSLKSHEVIAKMKEVQENEIYE